MGVRADSDSFRPPDPEVHVLRTVLGLALLTSAALVAPAQAADRSTATGYGGAVSTVDLDASRTAVQVLKQGGNAMDAAVAAAATLGVTEPYVAAIGGGGFLVYYDAKTRRVQTINGRETAPQGMKPDAFIDPKTGQPLAFADAVTSGLSVGVPGTLATWDQGLRRFGTKRLGTLLQPAIKVAERGFTVDQEFVDQTALNAARFAGIPDTAKLFLPGGQPPPVGSNFRNPDLAKTYRTLAERGSGWLYGGGLGKEIVNTVQHPPIDPASRTVRPGSMTVQDLKSYTAPFQPPTKVNYQGVDVYGMAPPSSGGSTVGEALNILENFKLSKDKPVEALHNYLEASKLAYADRAAYVGDVKVPLKELLSDEYAKERSCLIDQDTALTAPVAAGQPDGSYGTCPAASGTGKPLGYEGPQTTNLVVSDRWGNVAAYTLTLEQFGGSGLTVPGRGFILNNELTDFNFVPSATDPNSVAPGKRPRSSMAPTILVKNGKPFLAVGSPGGSTIITTVLQILLNRLDLGMSLPAAIAAPRATQRNTATTLAEQAFIDQYGPALTAKGQKLELFAGPPPFIGAATGLEFLGPHRVQAAAEPTRRHGGTALVVRPE
jgi:gamma-glutamyltranspeptidase / glutathione hydrolase